MSKIYLLVAIFASAAASAKTNYADMASKRMFKVLNQQFKVTPFALFNVGDTDNYSLTLDIGGGTGGLPGGTGGGLSGTMVMKVTAVNGTQITIDQATSIGGQNQDAVEVVDSQSGAVISITVNGQPQTPPSASDEQITSETLTSITVPAGTFKCEDVKIHMVSENTDAEQWVDIDDVPVGGMLKMTTTEQNIPIEADLTSFSKGS